MESTPDVEQNAEAPAMATIDENTAGVAAPLVADGLPPMTAQEDDEDDDSSSGSSDTDYEEFSTFRESDHRHQDLSWTGINMSIVDRKGEVQKEILKNVWGTAKAGETTAIMGASGAGKTSLFSILTGRIKSRGKIRTEHDIRLGGTRISPDSDVKVRNHFAVVSQEDALHASSTPRESFTFSAKLRLPRETTDKTIKHLVNECIRELGLKRCADSVIGGGLKKGISGGEKRRTSIGVEIIASPDIIFLDEPTSGLDSFATRQVMALLRKIAQQGHNTIIFTIHQPSSEIFATFDRLLLLNQGRLMYTGAVKDIPEDFATNNYPLPPNYNPADWVLDVAEENELEALETAGFFPAAPEVATALVEELVIPEQSHVSQWTELRMLNRREGISLKRNPAPMIINVVLTIFLSVLSGVIFFKVGEEERTDLLVMQAQLGALINILISTMMGQAQTALTIFSSERPLFLREYATRHYYILPYFLSHLATEALQSIVAVIVQAIVVFFMIGFQQKFYQFVAVSYTLSMTSTAVSVLLGSAVSDPKVATSMFTLVIVPQFYFSGVFIPISQIPAWIRWAQWLCSLNYASRLAQTYEFGPCAEAGQPVCVAYLEQTAVDLNDTWWYWLALVGLFLVFRIFAVIVLRQKALEFS